MFGKLGTSLGHLRAKIALLEVSAGYVPPVARANLIRAVYNLVIVPRIARCDSNLVKRLYLFRRRGRGRLVSRARGSV